MPFALVACSAAIDSGRQSPARNPASVPCCAHCEPTALPVFKINNSRTELVGLTVTRHLNL